MASVIAVCQSEKKGMKKQPVAEVTIREDYGVVGDAHADCLTHRQVSLLAVESIDKMRSKGFDLQPGDFAENITTDGIDLSLLPVGTRIKAGDEVILEQVTKQLRKLIDVIKVQDLNYAESITRELVLLTLFSPIERRQEVIITANTFGATVVDIAEKTITLEFVGNARKVNTIIRALEEFKVKEIARTGLVALPMESQIERNRGQTRPASS